MFNFFILLSWNGKIQDEFIFKFFNFCCCSWNERRTFIFGCNDELFEENESGTFHQVSNRWSSILWKVYFSIITIHFNPYYKDFHTNMIFQITSANTKVYQWAPSFEQSSHLGPIHRSCRWYVSRTKGIFVGSKWSLRNVGFVSGFYIIFIQLHRLHFLSPAFEESIVGGAFLSFHSKFGEAFPVWCETFLICCERFPEKPLSVKWRSTTCCV